MEWLWGERWHVGYWQAQSTIWTGDYVRYSETMCAIRIFSYLKVLLLKNQYVPDMSHRYFLIICYLKVRYLQGLL